MAGALQGHLHRFDDLFMQARRPAVNVAAFNVFGPHLVGWPGCCCSGVLRSLENKAACASVSAASFLSCFLCAAPPAVSEGAVAVGGASAGATKLVACVARPAQLLSSSLLRLWHARMTGRDAGRDAMCSI